MIAQTNGVKLDPISELPGPDRYGYSEAETARRLVREGWTITQEVGHIALRIEAPISHGVKLKAEIRYEHEKCPKAFATMSAGAYAFGAPASSILGAVTSLTNGISGNALLRAVTRADKENLEGLLRVVKSIAG
jgi:hypothetical protein